MSASNDLFELIKSMTSHEKRHFKLYATAYISGKSNKATRLFDVIDAQTEYDEQALKRELLAKGIQTNLPSAKYNLTGLILDSLSLNTSEGSIIMELRTQMARIEVLFRKGLFEQCRKLIARTRRRALKHERFEFLLEILYWERRYIIRDMSETLEDQLQAHYSSLRETLDKISSTSNYLELLDKIQSICARYQRLHRDEDLEQIRAIVDTPLLQNESLATSFVDKTSRLEALAFYSWITGDLASAMRHYQQAIQLWEQRPEYIVENLNRFKDYMTNYLVCCVSVKQFDDFEASVAKIKALPAASPTAEVRVFENVDYLELIYYLNSARLQEALSRAQEIERKIPSYQSSLRPNRLLALYHTCAIVYFLNERFGQALEVLHNILNFTDSDSRRDLRIFARIFQLIIHYELSNFEALERIIVNTTRFLRSRTEREQYQQLVISAIRKLLNASDKTAAQATFLRLRSELLEELQKGSTAPGIVEILFWIESKLSPSTMPEIYADKMSGPPPENPADLFKSEH